MIKSITWCFLLYVVSSIGIKVSQSSQRVDVFHYFNSEWGESIPGPYDCDNSIQCNWIVSDDFQVLGQGIETVKHNDPQSTTVAAYNIHLYNLKTSFLRPNRCALNAHLSIAESEESTTRFGPWLFDKSFPYFDGHSTTNPISDIPRIYKLAQNYTKTDLLPAVSFMSLLKAGSFVAGDCHQDDKYANINRNEIIQNIRDAGFRVDGLGKCMHSIGEGGVSLPPANSANDREADYTAKKNAISKYMFQFAFENSVEPGYVTEKPFHALIAGTVPVYLGDSTQLRKLLPHPKAAIILSDFTNITELVKYLKYLTTNEEDYEEHRAWRFTYEATSVNSKNELLRTSWQCSVCQWAVTTRNNRDKYVNTTQLTHKCDAATLRGKTSHPRTATAAAPLGSTQVYTLIGLLMLLFVLVTRMAVKLWCPQWLMRASRTK